MRNKLKFNGLLGAVCLVAAASFLMAAAPLSDRPPSRTLTIPVSSSTAVSISKGNTVASEAAGASTSDPNTFTLGTAGAAAHAVADSYNGRVVKFAGSASCAAANAAVHLIIDDAGASDVLTVSPVTDVAIDPNCTYTIGPALPSAIREICLGGCAGTCYISLRSNGQSGGTAGTDRITLTGGQWLCLSEPRFDTIELLSSTATDNAQVITQ